MPSSLATWWHSPSQTPLSPIVWVKSQDFPDQLLDSGNLFAHW
jgi:hypothetical protein